MTSEKILYLVRHAKSSWIDHNEQDFDRPLDDHGLRDVPSMGQRLHAREVSPDIVVCSPARRAMQTIELMTLDLGIKLSAIEPDKSIYEASTTTLLRIIHALDNKNNSAMIVGHNPGLSDLARQLVGSSVGNMPTCSVVTIRIASSYWRDAGTAQSELLDFDYPSKIETF